MKTKKPDRFEREVEALVKKYTTPGIERVTFTPDAVVKLLRKEHRAVIRMVCAEIRHNRKMVAATLLDDPKHEAHLARWTQCVEMLDHLTRRAT